MDKAQIIERMALVAHDQAAEVPEPSEQPFDLPAASVAAQRAAILGPGALTIASVGRDHLDSQGSERCVEAVRVVGAIPAKSLGHLIYEAGVEGGESGGDEGDLVRRSRGGTDGER